jgi:sialic acid synthase SpsE
MLNDALLDEIGSSSVPEVLLSAGGTALEEVEDAMARLPDKPVTVILGFQAYPTPIGENRLLRLRALRERFPEVTIGFADHTGREEAAGTWLPSLALALGATYIEKHITVAGVLRDPDHQSALAPDSFAEFVANMRLALAALGESQEAEAGEAERGYRLRMKKHVVAARDLQPGTPLSREELVLKRVADPPADVLFRLDEAVGEVLDAALPANAPLTRGLLR